MARPVVGVMPLWDDEKESVWMLPGYLDGIHQAGGIPVILPLSEDPEEIARLAGMCDGFLFTGGHDVTPEMYREEPLPELLSCCGIRDRMETVYLREALRAEKPVLGICRGIQLINAALGGTLYQDLPLQHPSDTNHHQRPPYDLPAHDVLVDPASPLYRCVQTERLPVNSCHHQAVKALAKDLAVMAAAPDGVVEAVCMPGYRFLWAVQWHPEFSWRTDPHSRAIFSAFTASAGN